MTDIPESLPYAALIGLDWSHQSHALVLHDLQTGSLEEKTLSADPADIHAWLEQLHQRYPEQKLALCLEFFRGGLVHQLAAVPFLDIYALNPVTSARYRKAFKPSGAKDDIPDAHLHLEILRHHRDKLALWRPLQTEDHRLLLLCEQRRKLVGLQVDLRNQLTSALREYFPQALELAGEDLATPMACAFLQKWPDLASLKRAKKETIRSFYYAKGCRRGNVIEERLRLIEEAHPLTEDRALLDVMGQYVQTLARQLQALNGSLEKFNKDLQKAFDSHRDCQLWKSFPGAGAVLAPRLAIAWTSDRERFDTVQDMQNYSGVSPVRSASGKKSATFRRYHRPLFLHQTFWEYAKQSTFYCTWAKAYVEDQLRRGKRRSSAYRSLAFKWQRIMFACWKTNTPYDDERYQASLRRNASPHATAQDAA